MMSNLSIKTHQSNRKSSNRGDVETAVKVDRVGKLYRLYDRQLDRLKHTLFWRLGKDYGKPFWALRDITFEVKRGETFGIIGKNGSGKSTLLQIIAGILQPNMGEVYAKGRIATLLELGSGFNPEFTGRENVILNGMILGIPREEMVERFDEIAAFADIGEFIDQPVKTYSSGMFVRLAFAVAAGMDADILLIDEALAVGDLFFRQKCYKRLEDLRDKGVSILFVSHAMNEVEQFCDRAILLNDSQMEYQGSAIETVKRYYLLQQMGEYRPLVDSLPLAIVPETTHEGMEAEVIAWPNQEAFFDLAGSTQVSNRIARCTGVAVCDQEGRASLAFQQGQTASFFFEYELLEDIEVPIGGIEIVNEKGTIVHGKNSLLYGSVVPFAVPEGSRLRFRQDIVLEIAPGEYSFNIGLSTISRKDYQQRAKLPHPELNARIDVLNIVPEAGQFSVVHRKYCEPVQMLHFGVANLSGRCQVAIVPGQLS